MRPQEGRMSGERLGSCKYERLPHLMVMQVPTIGKRSNKGRMADALALGGDEGRGKLR